MSLVSARTLLFTIVLVQAFGFMSSCKLNSDGRSSSTEGSLDAASVLSSGGFLKSSDFEVPKDKMSPISNGVFQIELDHRSTFYAKAPKSANLLDDACSKDEFNKMKFRAVGSTIILDGKPDLKHCVEKAAAANTETDSVAKYTFSAYDVHILVVFECEGIDLSKYDGKSYGDLASDSVAASICDSASKVRLISNTSFEIIGDVEFDGQKTSIANKSLSAIMAAGGKPCAKEKTSGGGGKLIGECLEIEANIEKDGASSTRFIATESGLSTKTQSDLYYSEGVMKFELNDWTGEMSYSAADKAPTWKAKGGPKNEDVTGTFGESNQGSKSVETEATPTPTPGGATLQLVPKIRKFAVPQLSLFRIAR